MLIRDPVHGDMALTRTEAYLLDAAEVQRLRGIKQLGTSYLVYPGCVHTRFDHALGTLAVAKRLLANLKRAGFSISAHEEELVGAAALLHDVTHIPFGHTFEDERRIFPRHDSGHRDDAFFRAGDLGRRLRETGLQEAVIALVRGGTAPGEAPWLGQLVASCIDADLLDYLRRDAYFAGLRHQYDDRIFASFVISDGQFAVDLMRHDMDRADVRSEVLHLLRLRYFLTERVYMHHAKIASGAMISKAVELAVRRGLREEDMYTLSDYTLFDHLARTAGDGSPTARLMERVLRRDLLKRAYVISPQTAGRQRQKELIKQYSGLGPARAALEEELARRLGIGPEDVAVYCPPQSAFKEADVLVHSRHGTVPFSSLPGPGHDEVRALKSQYADLWRFYVFVPAAHVAAAHRLCTDMFGAPSEYVPAAVSDGGRQNFAGSGVV